MNIDIILDDRFVYVPVELYCENIDPKRKFPIRFLVDTGCYETTIGQKDSQFMEVDFSKLQKNEQGAIGVGGTRGTYTLKNVYLFFTTDTGKQIPIRIEEVDVLEHEDDTPPLPSLLGTDVLQVFKLTYGKNTKLEFTR